MESAFLVYETVTTVRYSRTAAITAGNPLQNV